MQRCVITQSRPAKVAGATHGDSTIKSGIGFLRTNNDSNELRKPLAMQARLPGVGFARSTKRVAQGKVNERDLRKQMAMPPLAPVIQECQQNLN